MSKIGKVQLKRQTSSKKFACFVCLLLKHWPENLVDYLTNDDGDAVIHIRFKDQYFFMNILAAIDLICINNSEVDDFLSISADLKSIKLEFSKNEDDEESTYHIDRSIVHSETFERFCNIRKRKLVYDMRGQTIFSRMFRVFSPDNKRENITIIQKTSKNKKRSNHPQHPIDEFYLIIREKDVISAVMNSEKSLKSYPREWARLFYRIVGVPLFEQHRGSGLMGISDVKFKGEKYKLPRQPPSLLDSNNITDDDNGSITTSSSTTAANIVEKKRPKKRRRRFGKKISQPAMSLPPPLISSSSTSSSTAKKTKGKKKDVNILFENFIDNLDHEMIIRNTSFSADDDLGKCKKALVLKLCSSYLNK